MNNKLKKINIKYLSDLPLLRLNSINQGGIFAFASFLMMIFSAFPSFSQYEQYEWSKPLNLELLNSKYDEFAPSYHMWSNRFFFNSTKSGNSLYYFSTFNSKDEGLKSFSATTVLTDGINQTSSNQSYFSFADKENAFFTSFSQISTGSVMNIFQSRYLKNNWQKGELVESLKSDNFRFNPTISPSGKMMIFSEANPDNPEDADLWMTYLNEKKEWVGAVRLDELNSNLSEITPFLVSDDTLYFASNGFSGRGGFDIYHSININGKWQTPRPMSEFNTEFDESDFIRINSNLAVFSSNRPGGKGGLDLWTSELKLISDLPEEPELKLATSVSEIEVTKFRKFILADKSILEYSKIPESRYAKVNENYLKIYSDSFSVKPNYLEITVYPKFAKDFSKVEVKLQSETRSDSFLLENSKETSITKLIDLQKIASTYVNSNTLEISAAIVNSEDTHLAEKSKSIVMFNSTKELPEEVKINGNAFSVNIICLPKVVNDMVLAGNLELINILKTKSPSQRKVIIESSPTFDLTGNQIIRDWCKKAFFDYKDILFQKNIFPKLSDYLTSSDFNYLLILIQI